MAGQVITGAVVSSTFTVCTQVLKLPQASVALHVRVIVYWYCAQPTVPCVLTSLKVIMISATAEQLSAPVAIPVFAGEVSSSHSIVKSIGQVITGGVVSSTLIVCTQVLKLPQASVALHVLEIVYIYCGQPTVPCVLTSLKVMTTSSGAEQLSIPVAIPVLFGEVSSSHSIVVFAAQIIVGGVVSSTVIICVQTAVFPQGSEAVHVRVII